MGGSTAAVAFKAYQAVVGGSVRGLFLTLAETFAVVQFIQASAGVCDTSLDVLNQWKHVGRQDVPVWFGRFLKSCRNMHIPAAGFFYIDRGLVLTTLSVMTDAASSLILAN